MQSDRAYAVLSRLAEYVRSDGIALCGHDRPVFFLADVSSSTVFEEWFPLRKTGADQIFSQVETATDESAPTKSLFPFAVPSK